MEQRHRPKPIQAHGLTHQEMEDLRTLQNNQQVQMIPANRAHLINDPHFKEFVNHAIKEYNKHLYHILMEKRRFDQQSGKKVSKAQVSIFTPEVYKDMITHKGFEGWTTHIIHDPEQDKYLSGTRVLQKPKTTTIPDNPPDPNDDGKKSGKPEDDQSQSQSGQPNGLTENNQSKPTSEVPKEDEHQKEVNGGGSGPGPEMQVREIRQTESETVSLGGDAAAAAIIPENEEEEEISVDKIMKMDDVKELKSLYHEITGEEATKNWTAETTKRELLKFLGA